VNNFARLEMQERTSKDADNLKTEMMPTWKFVRHMIRIRPKMYFLNLGSVLLMYLVIQTLGFVTREFFNLLSGDAQVSDLDITGILLLAGLIYLVREVLHWIALYSRLNFFFEAGDTVRRNLFARILRRPGARALPRSPGEAISRFDGDVDELPVFTWLFNDTVSLGVVVIIAAVVMSSINLTMTAVVFAPMVILVGLTNLARNRLAHYRKEHRRTTSRVVGYVAETFGNVQAVKVAGAERYVLQRFDKLNDERKKAAVMDRTFMALLEAMFWNTLSLGTGIILLLSASQMRSGSFTVGDFALFIFYLDWVTEGMWFFGVVMARYHQAGIANERLTELLQGAPAEIMVQSPATSDLGTEPVDKALEAQLETLSIKGLTYQYPKSQNGIYDINLELKRGSFTVITGRIGSGKTTLLRVLLGLLPKHEGEIFWNGHLIKDPATFLVPPRTAYTGQVPRLFSEELESNILLGLLKDHADVPAAVRRAVMERDLETLDHGLQTMVGPKGVRLSGGQIQRSAAARMFVREPELLIFDDLSSALDVKTEKILWERVFEMDNAASLVVSHRHTALKQADHIIILDKGRVIAEGPLDELLENSEEMQLLWKGELSE
jgi:ATP-binding cassette subfamily B protein